MHIHQLSFLLFSALLQFTILYSPQVLSKMSREERFALFQAAETADKSLRFLALDKVEDKLKSSRLLLLFFGANWCSNTARFTPKYKVVQDEIDKLPRISESFEMYKIECTTDQEKYCVERFALEGYPTVFLFQNGVFKLEFPGPDESDALQKFIVDQVDMFARNQSSEAALSEKSSPVDQVKDKLEKGAERPPVLPASLQKTSSSSSSGAAVVAKTIDVVSSGQTGDLKVIFQSKCTIMS